MEQAYFDERLIDLFRKLGNNDLAIFCGAGVSFNSGLPLVNELLKSIMSTIEMPENEIDKILNSNLPFEGFIDVLMDETDPDELFDIFDNSEPNHAHYVIALLAQRGIVKNIMTTNFDQLIELALEKIGLKKSLDFHVYSSEDDFNNASLKADGINIVKIHGCVSDKKKMGITLKAVANKKNSKQKLNLISRFFSNDVNPTILIMGYSCSDIFDISPQLESIERDQSKVYFIDHIPDKSTVLIESLSKKTNNNPFTNFLNGHRVFINTDFFIQKFWARLSTESFVFIKKEPGAWSINVKRWYAGSIDTNGERVKHDLAAHLLFNIGEFNETIKHHHHSIKLSYRYKDSLGLSSSLGNLGMAYNAVGQFQDARQCLEQSVKMCRLLQNKENEIAQLGSLGNVYRDLGEMELAIDTLKKAIELARSINSNYSIGTCLGNLALVYNVIGKPDEAINCLTEGLDISYEIGNKQAEGSQLCSLGTAYFHNGEIEKAKEYLTKSVKVTRSIGDRRGESMALINLSNFYMSESNFKDSLKFAQMALTISSVLEITQNTAMAKYNIGISLTYLSNPKKGFGFIQSAILEFSKIYPVDHPHIISAKKALVIAKAEIDNPGIIKNLGFNIT